MSKLVHDKDDNDEKDDPGPGTKPTHPIAETKPGPGLKPKAEQLPAALPLPGYEGDQLVTLAGGGPTDGQWLVSGPPIPQTVAGAGVSYDLSDRAAGLYNVRVK